ncbi:hypothetical protein JMA_29570 [Jeotgalibacillus malaysiensis]|uniref:Uncharacterized protein n=1 Tax=Jeotgalibacillus malaysiensis TaxID=1508404 RepID=A0A0B5AW74_9BACL|nr:hypothetical protein JMA_29570 [Jeotgalibacillus malaysiensis]
MEAETPQPKARRLSNNRQESVRLKRSETIKEVKTKCLSFFFDFNLSKKTHFNPLFYNYSIQNRPKVVKLS